MSSVTQADLDRLAWVEFLDREGTPVCRFAATSDGEGGFMLDADRAQVLSGTQVRFVDADGDPIGEVPVRLPQVGHA